MVVSAAGAATAALQSLLSCIGCTVCFSKTNNEMLLGIDERTSKSVGRHCFVQFQGNSNLIQGMNNVCRGVVTGTVLSCIQYNDDDCNQSVRELDLYCTMPHSLNLFGNGLLCVCI